jgi:hypothetical protein
MTAVLDTRPGVLLVVAVVTWAAIIFLVLVIANLNIRLRRLERQRIEPEEPRRERHEPPYAALLGRDLAALTGEPGVRALIVLSLTCRSCRRLLTELATAGPPAVPIALAWADGRPGEPPPTGFPVLADGSRISADLGLRVTPFALVAGDDGRVGWAGPVVDLTTLMTRIPGRPAVSAS